MQEIIIRGWWWMRWICVCVFVLDWFGSKQTEKVLMSCHCICQRKNGPKLQPSTAN